MEEPAALRKAGEFASIVEDAKMAYFHEPPWQDMKQEPPHEFESAESQGFAYAAVPVIFVRERDGPRDFIV